MLDVIGVGATVHNTIDWYAVWMKSLERQEMETRAQEILQGSRDAPAVKWKPRQFSALFSVQIIALTRRAFFNYLTHTSYQQIPPLITH